MIGSGIQAILRLFPQQFQGFMKYAIEMTSGCLPSFVKIGSGVKKLLRDDWHAETDTHIMVIS
jgi:hypothetical protein